MLQKDLALKAGMKQSGLSKIEKGASIPDVLHLLAIARALGSTPGEILKEADNMADSLREEGVDVAEDRNANPSSTDNSLATGRHLMSVFGAKQ